jgi:arsenite methyltransferase
MSDTSRPTVDEVRNRYAAAARDAGDSCCDSGCCGDDGSFVSSLYRVEDIATLPRAATKASLGCGNPLAIAELRDGETVLDLGSGGGIDVLLSARRVGPKGFVYGLDMTDEMLELARRNQRESGVDNVEFLKGYIEEIPLPDASIDVVISNCVINLSLDKPKVLGEIARVLRPGGRIGISDVVAENHLTTEDRRERGSWVGCVAGALSFDEYEAGLRTAGFVDIAVEPTHQVAEGMHSAMVRAVRSHDSHLPPAP